MFKRFYSFINFQPTTLESRVVDKALRTVMALFDFVINIAILALGCYLVCGLCICAYYAVGQPTELASAVAYLAKIFP